MTSYDRHTEKMARDRVQEFHRVAARTRLVRLAHQRRSHAWAPGFRSRLAEGLMKLAMKLDPTPETSR